MLGGILQSDNKEKHNKEITGNKQTILGHLIFKKGQGNSTKQQQHQNPGIYIHWSIITQYWWSQVILASEDLGGASSFLSCGIIWVVPVLVLCLEFCAESIWPWADFTWRLLIAASISLVIIIYLNYLIHLDLTLVGHIHLEIHPSF